MDDEFVYMRIVQETVELMRWSSCPILEWMRSQKLATCFVVYVSTANLSHFEDAKDVDDVPH